MMENGKAPIYMIVCSLGLLWAVANAFVLAQCPPTCPMEDCVSNLCPLAQTSCSECQGLANCTWNGTCTQTDPQDGAWGDTTKVTNCTSCDQGDQSEQSVCNKVYGCYGPVGSTKCYLNTKDVRQPQDKIYYVTGFCPQGG